MRVKIAIVLAWVVIAACAGNIRPARQLEDAALAQSVRDALKSDAVLRSYDITVNVNAGAVTLLGVVGSNSHRERAQQLVAGVAGVNRVENLLSVR